MSARCGRAAGRARSDCVPVIRPRGARRPARGPRPRPAAPLLCVRPSPPGAPPPHPLAPPSPPTFEPRAAQPFAGPPISRNILTRLIINFNASTFQRAGQKKSPLQIGSFCVRGLRHESCLTRVVLRNFSKWRTLSRNNVSRPSTE